MEKLPTFEGRMNKLTVEVSDKATQPKGRGLSRQCTYVQTPLELGTSCVNATSELPSKPFLVQMVSSMTPPKSWENQIRLTS